MFVNPNSFTLVVPVEYQKYYYSCYPISIRQLRKYRKKLNRFYYELINKNVGNFKKNNKMKFSFEKVFLVAVKFNHSRTK